MALSLTLGQKADITEADPLLDEVDPEAFIADKAYDADPFVERLEERGITPVVSSRKNQHNSRKILFLIYKKRNIILPPLGAHHFSCIPRRGRL